MKIIGPQSYCLGTCCVKIAKRKNKIVVCNELPKIAMLPKKQDLVL